MAGLAVALSKALFAYDAWYTVTFVAEEVHDAHRTLPRALLLGCLLVTVLYVLTNVAYLCVLPVSQIAAVPENRVAERVAVVLFGNVGSTLIIVAILVSTFGCVNGMILGEARVRYAMAREGLFFRSLPQARHAKDTRDGAAVPGRRAVDADRLVLGVADLQHVRLGPFRRPDGGRRLPPAFQTAARSASLSPLGLSGDTGSLPGDLPGRFWSMSSRAIRWPQCSVSAGAHRDSFRLDLEGEAVPIVGGRLAAWWPRHETSTSTRRNGQSASAAGPASPVRFQHLPGLPGQERRLLAYQPGRGGGGHVRALPVLGASGGPLC